MRVLFFNHNRLYPNDKQNLSYLCYIYTQSKNHYNIFFYYYLLPHFVEVEHITIWSPLVLISTVHSVKEKIIINSGEALRSEISEGNVHIRFSQKEKKKNKQEGKKSLFIHAHMTNTTVDNLIILDTTGRGCPYLNCSIYFSFQFQLHLVLNCD